jgi:hypothetical protein
MMDSIFSSLSLSLRLEVELVFTTMDDFTIGLFLLGVFSSSSENSYDSESLSTSSSFTS